MIRESVGRVFDERGGIKVAYEFGVVDGFDTSVGKCCWWRRGLGGTFTLERIGWWSQVTKHDKVMEGFSVELE